MFDDTRHKLLCWRSLSDTRGSVAFYGRVGLANTVPQVK